MANQENGNATPMTRTLTFVNCVLALLATGCLHSGIGPRSLPVDRASYSVSLADSWKEQTLLNIVKIRYIDPPIFVDIGNIVASYSLAQSATLGGTILPKGGSNLTLGGSGTFIDSPTVTYTPLTGSAYIRGLLTPLSPTVVFSTVQNGAGTDSILLSSVASINGLKNQQATMNGITPADPDFHRVLSLMRQIEVSGAVRVYVKEDASHQQSSILAVHLKDIPPDTQDAIRELRVLLHLNPDATEFKLVYAPLPSSDTEIAVLTRSIVGLIANLAAQVEVPPEDLVRHRAFPGFEANHDVPNIVPLIRIHSSNTKPADAFVRIYYRNTWFWIDDGDLDSKHVFAQLMQLFTMADTGAREQSLPVITIPVR